MHQSQAPIAILGLALCTTQYSDLLALRRSLIGVPAEPSPKPSLSGVSELFHAVLRDGAIEPNDPRCSQLGVFITGTGAVGGIVEQVSKGMPTVLAENLGGQGALPALVRAAEALAAGDCRLAVILALDPSASVEGLCFEGSGVLLGQSDTPSARTYAQIYPGLVRNTGGAGTPDRAGLLLEASRRAGVDPGSLSLLDVQGCDHDIQALEALLGHLSTTLSRGEGHLSHCTVGPLLPSSSAVAALNGFCAVVLALYERWLPPLHGEFQEKAIIRPFAADRSPRPWIERTPRRAGVLALQPGVDVAMILEQAPGEPYSAPPRLEAAWPIELVLLSATGRAGLMEKINALAGQVSAPVGKPLREVAREYASAPCLDCRAAVLARDTQELSDKLGRLLNRLTESQSDRFQTPDGIYFAEGKPKPGKTALAIPGQGSQYLGMFGDLCLAFPQMQTWFERVHDVFGDAESCPPQFMIAPPRIGLSDEDRRVQQKRLYAIGSGATVMLCGCLGLYGLLANAGVKADAMIGYSNGENAALIASGTWRFSDTAHFFSTLTELRDNDIFERSGIDIPRGASAAVNNVPRQQLEGILAPFAGTVFLALDNCPDQVVLFGEPVALAEVTAQFAKAGAFCSALPFDRGHHTPLYQPHADMLLTLYRSFDFGPGSVPLYSCITAAAFPKEPDQIRALAASQWTRCVRFGETVQRLYEDGFRYFVEVGSGSRLSGFVHNTLRGHPHSALAVNLQGRPGLEQLLKSLGHLFVLGQDITLGPLFDQHNNGVMPNAESETLNLTAQPQGERLPDIAAARRILEGHFKLAQDFLASQQRSHRRLAEIFASREVAASPPRALRTPWPMLGEQIETGDGWLKARRTFTLARDPFLRHHAFGRRRSDAIEDIRGLPVIPFTFSMELLAEAAGCLAGWDSPRLTLSGLNAVRWLAVDDMLTVDIEARFADVSATGLKAVHVRIFEILDAQKGLRALAFEGWVRPDAQTDGIPLKPIAHNSTPHVSATQLNARLFHGPLLVSICGIEAIDAGGAELKAVVPPLEGLFQGQAKPALQIQPALLDALGQLVFYWLAGQGYQSVGLFPFHAARYVQFAPPPSPGSTVFLRGQTRLSANVTQADVEILDGQGRLLARIEGLKMKLYDFEDRYFRYVLGTESGIRLSERLGTQWSRHLPPPPDWFSTENQGIWTRLLARVALHDRERLASSKIPRGERLQWILVRLLAKELALDWLETLGVQAHPVEIEALATESGFLFQGEALSRLPETLCVKIDAAEHGAMAAIAWIREAA